MNPYTFSHISGQPNLSITLLAQDKATAIKRFNTIWGESVRYTVTDGYFNGSISNVLS